MVFFLFYVLVFKMFVLLAPYVCFIILTEWPPIGKIAAHSAYDMFSWYKYMVVNFVFPTSVLESESFSDCTFSFAYLYLSR